MKKKKTKKIGLLLILFVLVVGLVILSCMFYNKNVKQVFEISSRITNLEKMHKEKKEVIGWLKVQGTDIDYPVVDATTLDSLYDVDYTFVWKNSSNTKLEDKTTILGHNIRNVSKEPIITDKTHEYFEQLPSFIYYSFAKENKYIQYTIGKEDYIYKIYSVTFSNTEDEIYNSTFINDEEKQQYIERMKKNSLFNYSVAVDSNDVLISLVTCTRMFGAENTDVKIKVEGRLLRENEKMNDYKVVLSDSYDDILGGSLL